MTFINPEPNGHETLTTAEGFQLVFGRPPTPDEEAVYDAIIHAMYVEEFGEEPPQRYIYPDTPKPDSTP